MLNFRCPEHLPDGDLRQSSVTYKQHLHLDFLHTLYITLFSAFHGKVNMSEFHLMHKDSQMIETAKLKLMIHIHTINKGIA